MNYKHELSNDDLEKISGGG
ncbi:bacteriocin, partial [Listeria monocytogenes]|nr:bacteriocin [Listeria monocytogenes]